MTSSKSQLSFSKRVWIAGGIFSLIIVLLLLFKTLFGVILLSLAGILLAVYFRGFGNMLHRKLHWPPKLCIFLSVFINVLLLAGFFWFVGARLQQQVAQLSDTLPQTIQHLKEQLNQSDFGSKVLSSLNSAANSIKVESVAKKFFSGTFGVLSDLYVVILFAVFFTADPLLYKRGIIHLLPAKAKAKGDKLLDDLNDVLKKWLKAQIIGFFFIAIFTGIGLWIVGMPLILTLALIAGILNFVPNFGPLIALIPAVLLGLMQGPSTALIVACIYIGVQIIQSAVTQPIIQQKMVNLPPALTIFAQVAFGMLAGFWGVLLATPIVVIVLKIVNILYVENQESHQYEVK
ncbi:MAG: AI-2E family transporter [Ginsengibacter sp.]